MEPFTSKYSPKHLSDIISNHNHIEEMQRFILNPKGKALILEGPTGTGKTASVVALANDKSLELVELNASDFRNKEGINSIAGTASVQRSLFFSGKIILIDEADSVSGQKDRGAASAIAEMIEKSAFPVILTADDISESKFSPVRKKSRKLQWLPPTVDEIFTLLKKIADKEGIKADESSLKTLARRSGGDVRAAITDLEILSSGKKTLTKEDITESYDRDRHESIEKLLVKIFKSADPKLALSAMNDALEDPDESLMWIDENIPLEYSEPQDIEQAYDSLSMADVYRGRIRKRQYWRLLVYVTTLMSAGVAVSKSKKNPQIIAYKKTSRILKMWIANQRQASKKALAKLMVPKLHSSAKEILRSTIPVVLLLAKDPIFMSKLKKEFEDVDLEWMQKH